MQLEVRFIAHAAVSKFMSAGPAEPVESAVCLEMHPFAVRHRGEEAFCQPSPMITRRDDWDEGNGRPYGCQIAGHYGSGLSFEC